MGFFPVLSTSTFACNTPLLFLNFTLKFTVGRSLHHFPQPSQQSSCSKNLHRIKVHDNDPSAQTWELSLHIDKGGRARPPIASEAYLACPSAQWPALSRASLWCPLQLLGELPSPWWMGGPGLDRALQRPCLPPSDSPGVPMCRVTKWPPKLRLALGAQSIHSK